jgi:type I restriction enzyme S subunit
VKNGWQFLEFDNVFEDVTRHFVKIPTDKYQSHGTYAVVDQSQRSIAGYTDLDLPKQICNLPLIVFGDHTRVFKFINFKFFIGADGVKVIKLRLDGDEKYFFHFLNTLQIENNGYSRHFKFLKRTKILVPPLPEQKRIAAILDQADAIRRDRELAITKLDQLAQSIFVEMFGDPVINPKGWAVKKWGDVLNIINGKNQKKVEVLNGTYPIYGSAGNEMGRANDYLCCENSIIIGRKGNINKPILVKEKFWNVDTAFGLDPNNEFLSALYLYWFCNFFNFEKLNKTVTIPSLTKSDLLNIEIPLPPISLQEIFTSRIEAVEQLKADNNAALAKHNTLFASLQHSAFTGQL